MKFSAAFIFLMFTGNHLFAQKVDTMYINLYTDSLKKGRYNYINVEGRFEDGNWLPLDSTYVIFSSDEGVFRGNDLILPENPAKDKVTVTVSLRNNPALSESVVIFIKKEEEPLLQTEKEYLRNRRSN